MQNKYGGYRRCLSSESFAFGCHVIRSRWFTIFASVLIMSVNGATYLFGAYSDTIKSSLGYDQSTLNTISFFKDLGGNLGIFSGLIAEVSPPWLVLAVGAAMNLSGYLMIWATVSGRVAKPRVWQMCLYIWVGADSQAFANTGSLITCVKNFPESRGIVLGLLKGFVGLSGAIMAQIYHALHGNDTTSLILLVAWLPAAVSVIFLPVIRIVRVSRRDDDVSVFYHILYSSLLLAGFLMVVIILQNRLVFRRVEYACSASVVVLLLFVPLAIVVRREFRHRSSGSATASQIEPQQQQQNREAKLPCFGNAFSPPERGEDHTILQALFSADMAILFVAAACGIGGALTAIDNLGQIAKSLGYDSSTVTTFVSLVSIWNYLGRVAAGFISEIILDKYKLPRPLMLASVLLLSCAGHLLIAFPTANSLYAASIITGFCFGAQWPLLFAVISEIFGLKYYSTLFQFGAISSPVGAYVLNVKVAGNLYDREAMRQMHERGAVRREGEVLDCSGRECYRAAFTIITAAVFFGCLVSLILVVRTWAFYRGDIYRKFREEVAETPPSSTINTTSCDKSLTER